MNWVWVTVHCLYTTRQSKLLFLVFATIISIFLKLSLIPKNMQLRLTVLNQSRERTSTKTFLNSTGHVLSYSCLWRYNIFEGTQTNMKNMKSQIKELIENQEEVFKAIKKLSGWIRAIERRESTNVRNILESQSITDENVESKEKNEVQTLMETFKK